MKWTRLSLPTYNQVEGNNEQRKRKWERDCLCTQKQNNIKIIFKIEKLMLS